MNLTFLTFIIIFSCFYFYTVNAQIEGIFCGKDNCYSVLGVTREDDKASIMRAYRQKARLHHPDLQRTEEGKKEAETAFKKIVTAYDILKDDEQRKEYDYLLDNPEEMYYQYYQFFKRRLAPQVDIKIVLFVLISIFSLAQYYVQWSNYQEAVDFLIKTPRYRYEAKELAQSAGLLSNINKKKGSNQKSSKDELKKEEDKIIRHVITEKMYINPCEIKKGKFCKPSLKNTLWLQIFVFPVKFMILVASWSRWIVLYKIMRCEMSLEDKLEQIRWNLGTPRDIWNSIDESERQFYLKRELWIKEKYLIYAEELEMERKKALLDSSKYKRFQRQMRHGVGQISFVEDADF